MSIVVDTNLGKEKALAKIEAHVKTIGGWAKSVLGQPSNGLRFNKKMSKPILIPLIFLLLLSFFYYILGIILFLMVVGYMLTMEKITIVESSGKIIIKYRGKDAFRVATELANILKT